MNKKQLIVMWVGIGLIIIIGLDSPITTLSRPTRVEALAIGYAFILFVYWSMIAKVTWGLVQTLKDENYEYKKAD